MPRMTATGRACRCRGSKEWVTECRVLPIWFSKLRWARRGWRGEGWGHRSTVGDTERRKGRKVSEERKKKRRVNTWVRVVGVVINAGRARERRR